MTSPASPAPLPAVGEAPAVPEPTRSVPVRLVILALASLIVGGVTGWVWSRVVALPSYTVLPDGSASVSERGLTEFFAADARYVVCGSIVGLVIGVVTWRMFKQLGWPVAFVAAGAGLLAGLACWQFGQLFGPGPFDERLAAARPTDQVPIALELRSLSAIAVWAFAAVAPVLLGSSLGHDEEAERVPRRRRQIRDDADAEQVDDRGVLTEPSEPAGETAP